MHIIQVGYNPSVAKLYHADDKAKGRVSALLSYRVEGYEFTNAGARGWDGISTFFNWGPATFPRGFVDDVEAALKADGYEVQRVCRPLPEPLGPTHPVVDTFGDDPRYDYQREAVERLLQRGMCVARLATGGGKSRVAKLAVARIARPALFVTTRKVLMYQMHRSFEESGMACGVMGDGEWDPSPALNVAMIPTLAQRLACPEPYDESAAAMRQRRIRDKTVAFLENVQFLIGEEAHESGGNSYYEFIRHCRRAEYRLALTATPFMREDDEANMRLKAAFGPIGIEVGEKLLIERGILSRPIFKFITHKTSSRLLTRGTPYQRAVELGIVEDATRNQRIIEEVVRGASYGLTAMVLVVRKAHGEILQEAFEKVGLRSRYIYGDKNQRERDEALGLLRAGKIDVLIGTNILDVGVDVPAVGMVVIAGGGKAEVAHRQRIGRGLREKKSGPNVCLVVDFKDESNRHLRKHALSRFEIVSQTPGFAENILKGDEDFDYEALGFQRT
jgi:superfamily II DNA or RNA helicase